ncbi:hypothetical protein ACJXBB_001318 [Vibrio cholerae]|nr:hypothetical protein [Vibrio cholerae]
MKDKFGIITIVTLTLALLGVVAPIAWDYYSGQKDLTLTALSRNVVISPSVEVDGLEIKYKGSPLNTLSRTSFLIENTGSKPLIEGDIVAPIKIDVPKGVTIFEATIDVKIPDNLDVQLKKSDSSVEVLFSLLNPDDRVYLSLLTDSKALGFTASARIAGVKKLLVYHAPPEKLSMKSLVWIVVALLGLGIIILAVLMISDFPQEYKVKRAIKKNNLPIPDFESFEEARNWVNRTFSFTTREEREPLFRLLQRFEKNEQKISNDDVADEISLYIPKTTSNLTTALVMFAIGVFGISYAWSAMWS